MTRLVGTCYGQPVAEFDTEGEAKRALADHIHACPHGPMPWADLIKWHWGDGTDPKTGQSVMSPGWAASSRGEWLNHAILVEQ